MKRKRLRKKNIRLKATMGFEPRPYGKPRNRELMAPVPADKMRS